MKNKASYMNWCLATCKTHQGHKGSHNFSLIFCINPCYISKMCHTGRISLCCTCLITSVDFSYRVGSLSLAEEQPRVSQYQMLKRRDVITEDMKYLKCSLLYQQYKIKANGHSDEPK